MQINIQIEPLAPGARGIIFLPYLYGQGPPGNDPEATGAFLGMRSHHGRADLGRAVFEALACDARRLTDTLRRHLGLEIDTVTAIGGLGRARLWSELKAALLNVPIKLLDTPEAVALGAAMLAGLAAGTYTDVPDAVSAMRRPSEIIRPSPHLVEEYRTHYARWLSADAGIRTALASLDDGRTPSFRGWSGAPGTRCFRGWDRSPGTR